MKQRDWEVGIDVFKEILSSPSSIKLSRAELELKVVKDTFNTFGAAGLMSFVSRIPWQNLETGIGSITLSNSGETQTVQVNGLSLIASKTVVIKVGATRSFSVKGLKIADASGSNEQTVTSIDFSDAGQLHITTDKQRITNIPISFFFMKDLVEKVDVSAATVVKTVTALAMNRDFDWKSKITIILSNSNLLRIMNLTNEIAPQSSSFGATLETVIQKSKQILLGGSGNMLISGSLEAPLSCQMRFINIPLLGTKDIALTFASSFGIMDVKETSQKTVMGKIYGVNTGLGRVSTAEIAGAVIKLKVGSFTIPLDLEAQVNGKGVQLKSVTCK
jgi:hypothetical protein